MSELDDFRTKTLARQAEAVEALVLGDPAPWSEMWWTRDPVTLFGAWGPCKTGGDELNRIFRWVASRFSNVSDFRCDVEVVDISGDLAYTVGYERFNGSVDGGPIASITIRVTQVYRRENGQWKIVHRHGDFAPVDESPPVEASDDVGGTGGDRVDPPMKTAQRAGEALGALMPSQPNLIRQGVRLRWPGGSLCGLARSSLAVRRPRAGLVESVGSTEGPPAWVAPRLSLTSSTASALAGARHAR